MYARRAKEEAELHSLKYPNYRYQPLRRRSTKKAQQSALTARAGIRLTATNGEIFTTPLLNSQCTPSQIVRVPSSFPFVANKNKNNKSFFYQTKHTSSSPQVKQERLKASPFVFPSPLSKKRSSLNSQYGQSKAMTISPSLFLLSSYDQKPLAQFVPSASSLPVVNSNSGLCIGLTDPRLWPESFNTMQPFHGTSGDHSALWSVNDVNRVRPSTGNLEFPSYSNEKGPPSSSFYFSQLMNADITVAMNMAPPAGPSFPNKSLAHESSFNGGLYVQPITSDRSYQAVVSQNVPCSTTKYTPSSQDLIPSMKTEPVFVSPIMMDQDMDVSPVLSTCSSYSSLHDAATSSFPAESGSSGARHFESQIKTQSELVSQMLAHNLY
ncbi:hypothetical protein BGZ49_002975 [Haplosporangium sp. Z 27]|nr:hypothetical protein BGZ49_002975 [Haplosporangium sp. Z 27]